MNRKRLGLIGIGVLVVALVGATGYYLVKQDDNLVDADIENFLSVPKQYDCQGSGLIDTHLHLESDVIKESITNRINTYGVNCVVAFAYINPEDPIGSYEEIYENLPELDKFALFFQIDPKKPADVNKSNIEKVHGLMKNHVAGFGEVGLYRDPFRSSKLTDSHWQEVFKYSGEQQLPLMLHLQGSQQIPQLESMMSKYPKAKILIHGPEISDELPGLLKKYPQLYYTLDTATLFVENNGNNLMFGPGGKAEFLSALGTRRNELLQNSHDKWLPAFKAAPDRIMWGTDIALDWHVDIDVYESLIEFSYDFISKLPAEYRSKYRNLNAQEFLGIE